MKNILTLDGGGTRGIIQSTILNSIENKFDLVAGTSTGALIAVAIGIGISFDEITNFYYTEAPKIFKKDLLSTIATQLLYTKYPNNNRRNSLKKAFGDRLFGECKNHIMVCAYDAFNYKPKFFKSWREDDSKLKIVDICMMSSAAPLYFSPIPPGFIDGGVQSNSPSLPGYVESLVLWPNENINILSVGCGNSNNHIIENDNENSRLWGVSKWVTKIVDLLIDSPLQAEEYILKQLTNRVKDKYIRIQPDLQTIPQKIDDPSKEYLSSCVDVAKKWINTNQETIREIKSWNQ